MRSGDARPAAAAACPRRPRRARTGGFTYLLLLFALALVFAGLARLGEQWSTSAQRERETELLFRGGQIAHALALWRDATPAGRPTAPRALHELLVDDRGPRPRHHLRRLFTDPFTGHADWELMTDANGLVTGVTSRSRQPALRRPALPLRDGADAEAPSVGDWIFRADAVQATSVGGASR